MKWICNNLTKIKQKLIAPLQKNNLSVFKKKKGTLLISQYSLAPYVSFVLGFFLLLFFFCLEGLE